MLPLILRAVLIFPAEVAPAGGRLPWWPWLFAVFGPISSSWIFGVPLPPEIGFRAVFAVNVAFIATVLAVLTRNYRRASPIGRRQLKWVVLGFYVGLMPVLLADVVTAVAPALWWLHEVAVIAEILIPLCVLIAIVRTNYFDVDRLITATAVYSLLSVLLLAAVLTAVPQVARMASTAADWDPRTVQLVLSVVVAAGMVPGGRLLRPRLERVMFRERHALRAGVEDLLRELAAADGAEELLTLVGERLDALLRPQACVIYAPLGDGLAPVFARGSERYGGPPMLSAEATAIVARRARAAPLNVQQWRSAPAHPQTDDERAAFERLGAAALLPVRRGADLAAAICLGAKRSGDIYTDTDLALLAAVADKVSGELLRFDTAVILRQEREMSEALRRYVPEPVAARLTRGQAIEGGERDVSVLFVDIRGYSTYSEQQAAGTVFSMVNRYTEAVSAVIQRRGGTVVEFLGDGLMAVFGSLSSDPGHPRNAVLAALRMQALLGKINGVRAMSGTPPIAIGIGIHTDAVIVGNIGSRKRLEYTVVGDGVNTSSRLQALNKEFGTTILISETTYEAIKGQFECRQMPDTQLRGKTKDLKIYEVVSMKAAAAV
jgi:class 3 adenylate cyclase